jgi:hypothetical protein
MANNMHHDQLLSAIVGRQVTNAELADDEIPNVLAALNGVLGTLRAPDVVVRRQPDSSLRVEPDFPADGLDGLALHASGLVRQRGQTIAGAAIAQFLVRNPGVEGMALRLSHDMPTDNYSLNLWGVRGSDGRALEVDELEGVHDLEVVDDDALRAIYHRTTGNWVMSGDDMTVVIRRESLCGYLEQINNPAGPAVSGSVIWEFLARAGFEDADDAPAVRQRDR